MEMAAASGSFLKQAVRNRTRYQVAIYSLGRVTIKPE